MTDNESIPSYPLQSFEANYFVYKFLRFPSHPNETIFGSLLSWRQLERTFRFMDCDPYFLSLIPNPYIGLVNLFEVPEGVRITHRRVIDLPVEKYYNHVLPLPPEERRRTGEPSTVQDMNAFRRNWGIFSHGCLDSLGDWTNIVVAGGAIQACLAPVPPNASDDELRDLYDVLYPSSDVDIFMWGLKTHRESMRCIDTIIQAIVAKTGTDFEISYSNYAISIILPSPYRIVQIVHRLFERPSEILIHFDLDAPCSLYDGTRVWSAPRAIVAMSRQCNIYKASRVSPDYGVRLAKYGLRGFEVLVPDLKRTRFPSTSPNSLTIKGLPLTSALVDLLTLEKSFTEVQTLEDKQELFDGFLDRRKADRQREKLAKQKIRRTIHKFKKLAKSRPFIAAASAAAGSLTAFLVMSL